MTVSRMKGKWAQGIQPRNFAWIIKDRLAICERPGGYGANHRRVRRQEEIIWIREQGFTCVVTLIPSPHNLHNYDELGVPWRHVPFGPHEEPITVLQTVFPELADMLADPDDLLLPAHAPVVGAVPAWALAHREAVFQDPGEVPRLDALCPLPLHRHGHGLLMLLPS